MTIVFATLAFALAVACAAYAVAWIREKGRTSKLELELADAIKRAERERSELVKRIEKISAEVNRLSPWASVADADDMARQLIEHGNRARAEAEQQSSRRIADAQQHAEATVAHAKQEAARQLDDARAKSKEVSEEMRRALSIAAERAVQILEDANKKAEETAGKAMDAVRDAELYERTARAMKNVIEGYKELYVMPSSSFLDSLAADFGHKDAGRQLKIAREHTRLLVHNEQAARCDYVEANRREGAERFVIDAFNGKVDSILSRVEHNNYARLAEEINDAFATVNYGGKPFRDARVLGVYLEARLAELKWAAIVQDLKRQEREEQRRLREQARDEERARRDYERAIREGEREEHVLREAMARAQEQSRSATEAQRVEYDAKLADLVRRLEEAESRNQRALSMAQQTKRGHVYIISNVGSFGDDVYKIGVTRRLDPMERIWELGDASVPFDYDVHAVIFSEDAPALEVLLHKRFLLQQVNKINHRKEFFRVRLADIRKELEVMGIDAKWTMLAESREYKDTLAIEKMIETDPRAKEAWIKRQLTLETISAPALDEMQVEEAAVALERVEENA